MSKYEPQSPKSSNVSFEFAYRDASNYKNQGRVVFGGDGLPIKTATKRLASAFDSRRNFIAYQIHIPEVFLWNPLADYDLDDPPANLDPGDYAISEDDHCWHEFDKLKRTTDEETDRRTLTEFVEAVEQAAKQGWDDRWEPSDRKPGGLRNGEGWRSEVASVGKRLKKHFDHRREGAVAISSEGH